LPEIAARLYVTEGTVRSHLKNINRKLDVHSRLQAVERARAVGLLLGVIGVPLIGTAAAIGLILFFVCAVYTHMRAGDYSPQFVLATGFLLLAVTALVLDLASAGVSMHSHLRRSRSFKNAYTFGATSPAKPAR
jgi:uncharacterized membrane protein